MSDHSRAVLYSPVRMMRPQLVAEIGTLHAGTTEVLARALWENGGGVVHTADPYGGDRWPAVISQWPAELQFHAKSSMDFLVLTPAGARLIAQPAVVRNHHAAHDAIAR
jgi:hypothetical protein